MKELIAFTEYLQATGHDIGAISFQDAVALHMEVKESINKYFNK